MSTIYCLHCKGSNVDPWIVEDRGSGKGMYYWCNDCEDET
jgi:hypothetical protein